MAGTFAGFAQENPPIPVKVEVNTSQFLNFGAYTAGNAGGIVSVDDNGTRTSNGDIILLNYGETVSPALYDVTANPGTIITISHAPTFVLKNANGGGSMILRIDSYSQGQTFITTANPPSTTPIYIGGSLQVGNSSANPPGKYIGTIHLDFIQQ
ncbi:hypothetical protein GCM10007103_10860 [Salinimicrobium marinum]|uniref:DUF4402 domain-containing protein n=2 Tax=Salinimicrobium marinum TaxID=680283 RepID=A0A918SA89_9FLAO|nr:hypothetical protein GCM10007103_10860 [Salinimicrobium marinum]